MMLEKLFLKKNIADVTIVAGILCSVEFNYLHIACMMPETSVKSQDIQIQNNSYSEKKEKKKINRDNARISGTLQHLTESSTRKHTTHSDTDMLPHSRDI